MQVVSGGCREAYVQRRTVRVCTGGRGRLGLDDLLLLGGLGGGLALLPLPEAVLVHEPSRTRRLACGGGRAPRRSERHCTEGAVLQEYEKLVCGPGRHRRLYGAMPCWSVGSPGAGRRPLNGETWTSRPPSGLHSELVLLLALLRARPPSHVPPRGLRYLFIQVLCFA